MKPPIRCDPGTHFVWLRERRLDVALSAQEFVLLSLLCSRYGSFYMRDELGAAIWGAGKFGYGMLHRLVNRTKRKLGAELSGSITSVPGVGYKIELPQEASSLALNDVETARWSRFVGREPELAKLRAAAAAAALGKFRLVMIAGEAGVGKTRLAREFTDADGSKMACVLRGRCVESDGAVPFRPFIEALRPYAEALSDDELHDHTSSDPGVLASFFPGLDSRLGGVAASTSVEVEGQRLRLFEAITNFLRTAASRAPLLLFLDDLHWADRTSMLLLQHVSESIGDARMLILGAYRDHEVEDAHPLGTVISTLRRMERYERISLRGLNSADIREMIDASSPDQNGAASEAFAADMRRQTGGNPFFVREMLAHMHEEGVLYDENGQWTRRDAAAARPFVPEGIRDVIGRRIARLSNRCQRTLTLMSAMTAGCSWIELATIAGEQEGVLLDALDEALDAQLIREDQDEALDAYDFAHALVRETLYGRLSGARKALLHRRIGDALEHLYGEEHDEHVAELAHHFCAAASAGDRGKAIAYATRAGDRAMRSFAFEDAAVQYQNALKLLDTDVVADEEQVAELLIAIGGSQDESGDQSAALESFRRAAASARNLTTPLVQARAAIGFATAVGRASANGDRETSTESLALLRDALERLGAADSDLRVRVLCRLTVSAVYHSAFVEPSAQEPRIADARAALAMAERLQDPSLRLLSYGALRAALWGPAHTEERLATSASMVSLAVAERNSEAELEGRCGRLNALLELGRIDDVDAEFQCIAPLAAQARPPNEWYALAYRGMRATFGGDFSAAETLIGEALAAGQRRGLGWAFGDFANQIYELRRQQGRLSELDTMVTSLAEQFPATPAYQVALAQVHLAAGRVDAARIQFDRIAARDFEDIPRDQFWIVAMSLLSEVCSDLEDVARARTLYALMLPYAELNLVLDDVVVCAGSAARNLGQLATVLSLWDNAERHFKQAIAMNDRMAAHPWVAHTQFEYARMLLGRRFGADADQAGRLLDAALATGRAIGMTALVERAELLRATGRDVVMQRAKWRIDPPRDSVERGRSGVAAAVARAIDQKRSYKTGTDADSNRAT